MKTILSKRLCSFILVFFLLSSVFAQKGAANSSNSYEIYVHPEVKDLRLMQLVSTRDTSSMFYYSFEHQRTVKYNELLEESGFSFITTCVGRELLLSAPNYGSDAKYEWEGPGGFTSTLEEVKFSSVALKDDGIYTVVVTKGDLTVYGKIKLIVKELPTVSIARNTFEPNEIIELKAFENIANAKYEWHNMDRKIVSRSKDLWIAGQKEGTYNYLLKVNLNGCEVSKIFPISVSTNEERPLYRDTVEVLRHSY